MNDEKDKNSRENYELSLKELADTVIRLRELNCVSEASLASELININSDDGKKQRKGKLDSQLIPGGGTKTLVTFTCRDDQRITAWLDSGSTATLVTRRLIKQLNFQTYSVGSAVNFQGLFGEKNEREPECCIVTLSNNEFLGLSFPAYVVDTLASNADILIGTDQLGKAIRMDIGFNETLIVSIRDKYSRVIDYVIRGELGTRPEGSASRENFISSADSKVSNAMESIENNNHVEAASEVEDFGIETSNHLREGTSSNPQYESRETKSFEPVFSFVGNEDSRQIEFLMRRGRLMSQLEQTQQTLAKKRKTPNLKSKRNSRKQWRNLKIALEQQLKEREKEITKNIQKVDEEHHLYQKKLKQEAQDARLKSKSAINEIVMQLSQREGIEEPKITKKQRKQLKIRIDKKIELMGKADCRAFFEEEYNHWRDPQRVITEEINLMTAEALKVADQPLEREWEEPIGDDEEVKKYVPHTLRVSEQIQVDDLLRSKGHTLVGKDEKIQMGKATLPDGTRLEFDLEIAPEAQHKLTSKVTSRPYKIKKPLEELLKQTLIDMEAQGVGEMSKPDWSAEFASPAFFVMQKGKARFCVNYTELNDMTTNDVYPIPDIDSILNDFGGKKYFSIIDLKSGYHQFPLSERARKYAACIIPEGIFRYHCLTFGFKNAPAFFQRFMNHTFKDYIGKFMRIYIDDIVIFSNTFGEHLQHISIVLDRLAQCNIKANRDKCHFFLKEMRVLGKIVNEKGVKPDPDLIKDMVNYPIPNSKTKIRAFLALCSHYRHFVKDFYKYAAVLNPLTREDCTWNSETWYSQAEYQRAFEDLKREMTTVGKNTVLAFPDWNKPFHIQSDACLLGAGAVLTQFSEGGKKNIVAYASWNFSDTEKRYTTTERELLGFLFAVRKWKAFLWGRRFEAETDHQPLTGTLKLEDPHGRIARWSAELAQYDFKLKYLRGKENVTADALSRVFDETLNFMSSKQLQDSMDVEIREEIVLKLKMSNIEKDLEGNSAKGLAIGYNKFWGEEEIEEEYLIEENILGFIDYSLPSNEEWLKAQIADPDFADIYAYISRKVVPKDPQKAKAAIHESQYFLIHEKTKLLLRNTKIRHTDKDSSLRICLPKEYFSLMTKLYHDSVWAGGHQGVEKTLDKISERFYHGSIRAYVKAWVRTCEVCLRNKRAHPIGSLNKHPTGSIQPTQPWELLCIDVWEPGVVSTMGHSSVLTVIDAFSRFAWALPLTNAKAETIAYALYQHVLTVFPMPKRIHSDMGKNLIGEVITQLKNLFHVESSHTTAYHPEGNSIAERIHQFFRNSLTAYISEDQKDWDLFLPALLKIYRDATHTGLGNLYSPSEIVFGRKLGSLDSETIMHACEKESAYVEKLRLALARAAKCVLAECEKLRKKKIELKEKKDKILIDNKLHRWVRKTRKTPFKVGDRVGLRVEQVGTEFESKKLFPRFQGPYTIASMSRDNKACYLFNPYIGKEEVSPVPVTRLIDFPLRKNLIPESIELEKEEGKEEVEKEDDEEMYQKVQIDNFSEDNDSSEENERPMADIDDVEPIEGPFDPLAQKIILFDGLETRKEKKSTVNVKTTSRGRVVKAPKRF